MTLILISKKLISRYVTLADRRTRSSNETALLLDKIFKYAQDRNDPITDGTSRLSAYLASGIISPKDAY